MRMRCVLISATLLAVVGTQGCATEHAHKSQYAGQQTRTIKSLSPDDIAELKRGGGWGLAKAAELNGLPGPIHVLELKDDIALTAKQTENIQALYDGMKTQAIESGERLIKLEQALEKRFQSDPPTDEELAMMLDEIGKTRTNLRFIHLATHLKTPLILSKQQIETYNSLRGYGTGDPCKKIPKGHNPAMWKKHNGCN